MESGWNATIREGLGDSLECTAYVQSNVIKYYINDWSGRGILVGLISSISGIVTVWKFKSGGWNKANTSRSSNLEPYVEDLV